MRSVTSVLRHALIVTLLACAVIRPDPGTAADTDVARVLAPSGHLRAGLYPGTPTSILPDGTDNPRGVGYAIGKELALRLHVDYEPVVFAKNAEVLEAVKTGAVDVAFTNASPARAKEMDFGPVYLAIELGYLVPDGSPLSGVGDVDAAGRKVGVTAGSTSDATLGRELKNAALVRAPTLKDAVAMLANRQIDAFATNKATLFEMAEQIPGSRVLDGRWGEERHAIAIPKGREAGLDVLRSFTDEIRSSGLVSAAAERAGLRGVVAP
ncbi:ABC transporter substrate-binding protein [Bradyrhizobium sp. SSBR45G]|uniref:ABC transporter substrate-binding protein n=1 Tax=unclassified Bradyrhizobium TaxID=2631580 RepID=UPI002342A80D|nr:MULTISPECIES: ABC transporter substrate-binding protein [unclassified Bradyrhizobium]GLH81845.1 ABC transporter substrate-binding protein [Bradyrhizobium sp. SSBR45G]GLH89324.1 ABC transporter substrate-binding protein [Bradyrhizobium sp. SSBR45R]